MDRIINEKIAVYTKNKELITFLKKSNFNMIFCQDQKKLIYEVIIRKNLLLIIDSKILLINNIKNLFNKNNNISIILIIENYLDLKKFKNYGKYGIKDFFINGKENYPILTILIKKNIKQMFYERDLEESEKKYKKIFDNSTEGILIIQDGIIKFANPYVYKLSKYKNNEVINKPFLNFVYQQDIENAKYVYIQRTKGKYKNESNLIRFIDKNKKILWLNTSGVKVDWEGEQAVLYFISDITNQKIIEDELKFSEENSKALLNATKDLAFLIKSDGTILSTNQIAKERIGKNNNNFFKSSPKYLFNIRKNIKNKLIETKSTISFEEVHKQRSYHINIHPILNEQNEISRLAVYASDITAYKEAENQIKNSEERFRALIVNLLDGIIIINKFGHIKFATENVKKVLGYDVEEALNKNAFSFIHSSDYKVLFDAFAKILKDKNYNKVSEFKGIHKDGALRMLEGIGINLLDNPAIRGIVITFRDISERKKAQTELNIYKYIVSSSSDQITYINNDYLILAANEALLKAFKISKDDLIGYSLSKIFGENDFRNYFKSYCDQCFSGLEVNFERWFEYPSLGKRYMSFSLYPYLENNIISGIVINSRDLTERIEMEMDIVDLREKEQQRIGIELHDGLSHNLLSIAIKSRILADKLKKMNIHEEKEAKEIETNINKTIEETRSLARGLFHSDLEDTSILALLKNIKNDIETRYNLKCCVEIDDKIEINNIKFLHSFII